MTGNELAKAIKRTSGKVSVPMLTPNDVPYVYAEKRDLIDWASRIGDRETGMTLGDDGDCWALIRAED